LEIDYSNTNFETTYVALEDGIDWIVLQGGTFSGKTFGAILAHVIFAKYKGLNESISCIAPSFPQLERGILKDFKTIRDALPGFVHYSNESKHIYKIGNSTFNFFSIDKAGKARSGKRDRSIIDECNLIDWETVELLTGKSTKSSTLCYNPYSTFWFHDKIVGIYPDERIRFRISTYKDNYKNLSRKTIEFIENIHKTDPEKAKVLVDGKLGSGKGLIIPSIKLVTTMPDCHYVYGLDLGYTNDPTALIKLGLYQGELYGQCFIYETGLKRRKLESIMIRELGMTEDDIIVCDTDHTLIDELITNGWNVIKSRKREVKLGIDQLNQYPINIHYQSYDWIKEQQLYRYKIVDGVIDYTKIPRTTNADHCWDAARYACEELLEPFVGSSGKTSRRRI